MSERDIVDVLRRKASMLCPPKYPIEKTWAWEAADEIERLRARLRAPVDPPERVSEQDMWVDLKGRKSRLGEYVERVSEASAHREALEEIGEARVWHDGSDTCAWCKGPLGVDFADSHHNETCPTAIARRALAQHVGGEG